MASAKSKKVKPPRTVLREVDRAIIQAVMFNRGIVPMEQTTFDMRRALAQLPPEEARVLKRKFRKEWRRALKSMNTTPSRSTHQADADKRRLGVGKTVPSRSERNARKQLVFNELWQTIICQLIENFENSVGGDSKKDDTQS